MPRKTWDYVKKKKKVVCPRPTDRPQRSDRKTFVYNFSSFFSTSIMILPSKTWLTTLICPVYRCFDRKHNLSDTVCMFLIRLTMFDEMSIHTMSLQNNIELMMPGSKWKLHIFEKLMIALFCQSILIFSVMTTTNILFQCTIDLRCHFCCWKKKKFPRLTNPA